MRRWSSIRSTSPCTRPSGTRMEYPLQNQHHRNNPRIGINADDANDDAANNQPNSETRMLLQDQGNSSGAESSPLNEIQGGQTSPTVVRGQEDIEEGEITGEGTHADAQVSAPGAGFEDHLEVEPPAMTGSEEAMAWGAEPAAMSEEAVALEAEPRAMTGSEEVHSGMGALDAGGLDVGGPEVGQGSGAGAQEVDQGSTAVGGKVSLMEEVLLMLYQLYQNPEWTAFKFNEELTNYWIRNGISNGICKKRLDKNRGSTLKYVVDITKLLVSTKRKSGFYKFCDNLEAGMSFSKFKMYGKNSGSVAGVPAVGPSGMDAGGLEVVGGSGVQEGGSAAPTLQAQPENCLNQMQAGNSEGTPPTSNTFEASPAIATEAQDVDDPSGVRDLEVGGGSGSLALEGGGGSGSPALEGGGGSGSLALEVGGVSASLALEGGGGSASLALKVGGGSASLALEGGSGSGTDALEGDQGHSRKRQREAARDQEGDQDIKRKKEQPARAQPPQMNCSEGLPRGTGTSDDFALQGQEENCINEMQAGNSQGIAPQSNALEVSQVIATGAQKVGPSSDLDFPSGVCWGTAMALTGRPPSTMLRQGTSDEFATGVRWGIAHCYP
eukprot:gene16145-22302_t